VADPVSWLVVQRGWEVLDREGERVGQVEEMLGDENADIFHGLSIATSLVGAPRYVPAEQVAEIRDGCVRLALAGSDVEQLPAYEP